MKYTIAIVTRNRAKDLKECIESIALQTMQPDQLLIVDNASNDNTKEMVKIFQCPFQLDYVYCSKIGISHARNAALSACKSEIICFLDDDSVADRNWLCDIAETFIKRQQCGGVQGYIGNHYPNNITAILTQFQRDIMMSVSVCSNLVRRVEFAAAGNLSFRMETLKSKQLNFNTNLQAGEEQDIVKRLVESGSQLAYSHSAVILHKWKKTIHSYLLRRFKSGFSSAKLQRKHQDGNQIVLTSGISKQFIWQSAKRHVGNLGPIQRAAFLIFLILSNISRKFGYLCGRFLILFD